MLGGNHLFLTSVTQKIIPKRFRMNISTKTTERSWVIAHAQCCVVYMNCKAFQFIGRDGIRVQENKDVCERSFIPQYSEQMAFDVSKLRIIAAKIIINVIERYFEAPDFFRTESLFTTNSKPLATMCIVVLCFNIIRSASPRISREAAFHQSCSVHLLGGRHWQTRYWYQNVRSVDLKRAWNLFSPGVYNPFLNFTPLQQ